IGLQYFLLLKSHALEQRVRARIEHLKKSRVIHNSCRIAVSPLHLYLFPILLHLVRPRATASRGVYLTPSRLTKSFFLRPGTFTLSSCRSSMASSTLHPSNRFSRTRLPSSSCSISNPPSPAPNPKPASSHPPPAPSSPPIVAPNFSTFPHSPPPFPPPLILQFLLSNSSPNSSPGKTPTPPASSTGAPPARTPSTPPSSSSF